MNKDQLLYSVIGVIIGIILTAGYFQLNNGQRISSSMMNTSFNQMPMVSNMDAHFIEQMIPHHQDAITMAELALVQAKQPEIKKLAEDIKRTQSEEIEKMRGWYKSWFGKDVPESNMSTTGMGMMGRMHQGMMGDETDVERLKNASDFDKAFIEEMIPHHQMAVMMANMLLRSTNREEMKTLAQDIIDAQTKEINDMRQWHRNWGY